MDLHRSGEDYLETMLILEQRNGRIRSSDVARYLKVSRASVSYAVRFLKNGGFLTVDEGRLLHFTDIGRQTAEAVYEKHCILRDTLLLLGADPEIADQDACLIEHDISGHTMEKLKVFLKKHKESGK
ncbi:MAG: metal-dependent transcriptional regulator [Oscillospiraceae bacterium]|nr:metal-dependent transcriptional regulator [Oscillospiraceae bacterium]